MEERPNFRVLFLITCLVGIPFAHFHEENHYDGSDEDARLSLYWETLLENAPEYVETLAEEFLDVVEYDLLMEDVAEIYNGPGIPMIDCAGCRAVVAGIQAIINQGLDYWDVRDQVIQICHRLVNESEPGARYDILCPGTVDNYGPHVVYVLNVTDDTPHEICVLYNNCEVDEEPEPTTGPPDSDILRYGQLDHKSKRKLTTQQKRPSIEDGIKVVHITDIHVDELYVEGTVTDCGLPLCCREDFEGEGEAHYLGDYDCNIPPHTVERILQFVASLEPDMVAYTGDSPPHAIWLETQWGQLNASRWVADALAANVPGVPAYPSIGNHETYPTNLYYTGRPEVQEFNYEFGRFWADVAGFSESQLETLDIAGYYTIEVPGFSGLRVLAYNSNYGEGKNFYGPLLQEDVGFISMKAFMETTLEEARENNEKIILLGHHKSGSGSNFHFMGKLVTDLAKEYGDLIILHLLGHSHKDNFRMTTNLETGEAFNVQMSSPGLGCKTEINPSVRLIYLDPATYRPLDFIQYNMDLRRIIEEGLEPTMEVFYTASSEYDMPDLTPASYADFVDRMEEDQELFERYLYLEGTGSRTVGSCTGSCKRNTLCSLRTTLNEDYKRCRNDYV